MTITLVLVGEVVLLLVVPTLGILHLAVLHLVVPHLLEALYLGSLHQVVVLLQTEYSDLIGICKLVGLCWVDLVCLVGLLNIGLCHLLWSYDLSWG
jgi:hypothetical protein